ncbi:thioredoxin fold domain-containing protein [Variovorax sp. MHTC-1]|uniref:thioredoxin fold domain-containing protein n=1 Tax=Variovorax sp. MHTC-1 TaxID=2495593 RepID=UPI00163D2870|nr:thioredoxin fold domain-containing protein [Variovorax sp. MHTC-1]
MNRLGDQAGQGQWCGQDRHLRGSRLSVLQGAGHPDATARSRAVWCARDRVKAWDEVMRTIAPAAAAADCDNPIGKIVEFAKRHRITGTPTTILADGRRLVGAVPRAELEAQLQQAAKR